MPTTLAEALTPDRIEMEVLEERYRPVLNLVDVLIGVVPYCDRYLEIWPVGFRTYNLMVPNFLDLPASLFGKSVPKDIAGLAMYRSSMAASCMYCSAHTCSFALRRGSSADAVTGEHRTPVEAAAVAVAEALSTMPHHWSPELGRELRSLLGPKHAEWVVMSVAMMGFLNKFMDALGVELEREAVDDVSELIGPHGWSIGQHAWAGVEASGGERPLPPVDSRRTMMQVMRNAPGAVRLDRGWQAGVPAAGPEARRYLAEQFGLDEPVLTEMNLARPSRALTSMLRHNLDAEQSEIGIAAKALVGLVFATHAGNDHLLRQDRELALHAGASEPQIKAATAVTGPMTGDVDPKTGAILELASAISPSPAVMDERIVSLATEHLSSSEIVEVAVWVSVSQLRHRLALYYGLAS